jgi:hypothetical protein
MVGQENALATGNPRGIHFQGSTPHRASSAAWPLVGPLHLVLTAVTCHHSRRPTLLTHAPQNRAVANLFKSPNRLEDIGGVISRLESGDLKLRVRALEAERALQRVQVRGGNARGEGLGVGKCRGLRQRRVTALRRVSCVSSGCRVVAPGGPRLCPWHTPMLRRPS